MMKVALIGATGAVGRQMLRDLEESDLDVEVLALASPRSAGQKLPFGDAQLVVQPFSLDSLSGCQVALMSAGGAFSREWSRQIVELGVSVIDNSSAWRMHDDVPLVVPEVNSKALSQSGAQIIANPNCSTIQLVVSLLPLQKQFGLKKVFVSTYQSVSGAGQAGISELKSQLSQTVAGSPLVAEKFQRPIAKNVIPAIDVIDEAGHAFEEEKMVRETRKILGVSDLFMTATTARVPTEICHAESVTVELEKSVSIDQVFEALEGQEGLVVSRGKDYESFHDPLRVAGKPGVYVSRIRLPLDATESDVVQFWNVADNLRKGAASNAVQILENLVSKGN